MPLVTHDHVRLGALSIIDRKPRRMNTEQIQLLINLAELTVRELLKTEVAERFGKTPTSSKLPQVPKISRRVPSIRRVHEVRQVWFQHGLEDGTLVVDTSFQAWRVLWSNSDWQQWRKNSGAGDWTPSHVLGDYLHPASPGGTLHEMQDTILEQLSSSSSKAVALPCLAVHRRLGEEEAVFSKPVFCVAAAADAPICIAACLIGVPPNLGCEPAEAEEMSFRPGSIVVLTVRLAK